MDAETWRPPHLHVLVRATGYGTLVALPFFAGAPHLDADLLVKQALITKLSDARGDTAPYERGRFDIVLACDVETD